MRSFILAVIAAFSLVGCSKEIEVDPTFAEQIVPQFHMALKEGRFEEIYNGASDELKKRETQKDFTARLQKVREKMGEISGTDRQNHKARQKSDDIFVTLTYTSKYAAGEATEDFVVLVRDNAARLLDYKIKAKPLDAS